MSKLNRVFRPQKHKEKEGKDPAIKALEERVQELEQKLEQTMLETKALKRLSIDRI